MSNEITKRRKRTIEMTQGSLWKNMFFFSVPLIFSQILEVMFNLSDVAVVGHFADYKALGSLANSLYENYISKANLKGVSTILYTPIVRRTSDNWTDEELHITKNSGEFEGGDYRKSILDLGKTLNIPVIDLTSLTKNLYDNLGVNETKYLHAWTSSNPSSIDNTHTNIWGANYNAYFMAKELYNMNLENISKAILLNKIDKSPSKNEILITNPNYVEKTYNNIQKNSEYWEDFSIFKGTVFGDTGGTIDKNSFYLGKNSEGNMNIKVIGNKGKIANSVDGIAMYYYKIPAGSTFTLKALMTINDFAVNNQVSFGLMVRDKVLIDTNDNKMSDDCIALGPLGLATDTSLSFNRKNGILEKKGNYVAKPLVGDKLDFSLKKMGNLYLLKAGNQESVVINNFDFAGDNLYVGLFVARNAKITFENISLERNIEKPESLKINNLKKTKYLLGENISLKDLEVKAIYENRQEKTLNSSEYVVTNYSNDKVGKKIIEFNFNGAKKEVEIEVLPLKLSEIEIVYEPIKTKYYMLDSFSEEGLVVNAVYNNGYKKEEIRKEKYDIFIDGKQQTSENPYIFNKSGNYKVTLISKEDKNVTKTFNISVNNAKLKKLEIRKQPLKTKYFIGENLDLNGLVVYAIYSDNKEVKLSKDELTINSLDTSIVGEKNIKISYKGKSENLKFNVKDKEPVSLVVSKYPKTTFSKEEKVDFTGMEISILYDNGETQKIEDFKVDKSQIKEIGRAHV